MAVGPRLTRIRLPTQLPVGPVNAYLLRGEENVLVDAGPHHPESLKSLEKRLGKEGVKLSDIDIVLITHGHVDHYGQAGEISSASGAEVWVHELDREMVVDFATAYDERSDFYRRKFLKTGIPTAMLERVGGFFDYVKSLARPSPIHRTFRDGDTLELGGWEFEVIHTPGHSAGSTCFQSGTTLIAGDTVLKRITPNAAFGGADGESVGMADYLQSLDRLSRRDVEAVYSGHGPPLKGLGEFIDNYRGLYADRRKALLDLLSRGRYTTMDLVKHLFDNLPIEEVFLGVTEVLGHLEILEREGLVEAEERGGLLLYTTVDDG